GITNAGKDGGKMASRLSLALALAGFFFFIAYVVDQVRNANNSSTLPVALKGHVAFVTRGQSSGISIVDVNGGSERQLLADTDIRPGLSWSPDGRQLAFVSGRDGNLNIFSLDVTRLVAKRLTT